MRGSNNFSILVRRCNPTKVKGNKTFLCEFNFNMSEWSFEYVVKSMLMPGVSLFGLVMISFWIKTSFMLPLLCQLYELCLIYLFSKLWLVWAFLFLFSKCWYWLVFIIYHLLYISSSTVLTILDVLHPLSMCKYFGRRVGTSLDSSLQHYLAIFEWDQ